MVFILFQIEGGIVTSLPCRPDRSGKCFCRPAACRTPEFAEQDSQAHQQTAILSLDAIGDAAGLDRRYISQACSRHTSYNACVYFVSADRQSPDPP